MAQNLLASIGLKDDADISVAGTRFVECVKEYIGHVEKNASKDTVEKENSEMTALYNSFFPYSVAWAQRARSLNQNQKDHPEAANLKDKGASAIDDLQANIIKFALCYMAIARSRGLINAEIKNAPEAPDADVQWTSKTAVLLRKHRSKRASLLQDNDRLLKARDLLKPAYTYYSVAEKHAKDIYGADQADKLLQPYRSGLRVGNFKKARAALKKLLSEKTKFAFDKKKIDRIKATIEKEASAYIDFLESHQQDVASSGDKLFLKPTEIGIVFDANQKELAQSEAFIKKYFRPFLNYQIDTLKHLRTKMLVVGSLESLMTLYIRMMRGIAEPLADIKAVRLYESEVIEHVMYLLGGQFQETKNIEKRIEEILHDVSISVHDYEGVKE